MPHSEDDHDFSRFPSRLVGPESPGDVFFIRSRTLIKPIEVVNGKIIQNTSFNLSLDTQDGFVQLSGGGRNPMRFLYVFLTRFQPFLNRPYPTGEFTHICTVLTNLVQFFHSQDDHDLVRRQLSGGVRNPHEVAVRVLHRDPAPAQLHKSLPLESAHGAPQLHVAHVKSRKQHLDRFRCLLLRAVFTAV